MRKLLQPLLDKVNSRYRKFKYGKNKYFRIDIDTSHTGILAIELLRGPFKGIIYSYGEISIDEDLGYKGARASFDVSIIKGSNDLLNDVKFAKIIGDILLSVLEEVVSAQAEKYLKDNFDEEIREDYFEEPVPQRTVHSKDPTVSEDRLPARPKRKNPVRRSTKVRSKVQQNTDA